MWFRSSPSASSRTHNKNNAYLSLPSDVHRTIINEIIKESKFPVNPKYSGITTELTQIYKSEIKKHNDEFRASFMKKMSVVINNLKTNLKAQLGPFPRYTFKVHFNVLLDIKYTVKDKPNIATIIYPFNITYKDGKITNLRYRMDIEGDYYDKSPLKDSANLVEMICRTIFKQGVGFGENDAIVSDYTLDYTMYIYGTNEGDIIDGIGDPEDMAISPHVKSWQKHIFRDLFYQLMQNYQITDYMEQHYACSFLQILDLERCDLYEAIYQFLNVKFVLSEKGYKIDKTPIILKKSRCF